MIEEGAVGMSAAGAVTANARGGPAGVINRLEGLHRCDNLQLRKTIKVFCRHVLCMLDAKTAVPIAICFGNLAINIQHDGNGLVADGMRTNL